MLSVLLAALIPSVPGARSNSSLVLGLVYYVAALRPAATVLTSFPWIN